MFSTITLFSSLPTTNYTIPQPPPPRQLYSHPGNRSEGPNVHTEAFFIEAIPVLIVLFIEAIPIEVIPGLKVQLPIQAHTELAGLKVPPIEAILIEVPSPGQPGPHIEAIPIEVISGQNVSTSHPQLLLRTQHSEETAGLPMRLSLLKQFFLKQFLLKQFLLKQFPSHLIRYSPTKLTIKWIYIQPPWSDVSSPRAILWAWPSMWFILKLIHMYLHIPKQYKTFLDWGSISFESQCTAGSIMAPTFFPINGQQTLPITHKTPSLRAFWLSLHKQIFANL